MLYQPFLKRYAIAATALADKWAHSPNEFSRACEIIAAYPTAWREYSADPDNWPERAVVARLYGWAQENPEDAKRMDCELAALMLAGA